MLKVSADSLLAEASKMTNSMFYRLYLKHNELPIIG